MENGIIFDPEKELKPYLHVWSYFNDKNDWAENSFASHKAKICVAFSRATYWHLTKLELTEKSRFNIIPSGEYLVLKKSRIVVEVRELLQNSDFNENFIFETEFAVLIGVVIRNVLFIAIRGTETFYDWMTDFQIAKISCQSINNLKYHKGFYNATVDCIPTLVEKLETLRGKFDLIYITGHSLGGAIAAILHSLMQPDKQLEKNKYNRMLKPYLSTSCYTFGMPKYGNLAAATFKFPIHLLHEGDLIPTVPPSWLGYKESEDRIVMPDPLPSDRGSKSFIFGWKRRLQYVKAKHEIENYYESVKRI